MAERAAVSKNQALDEGREGGSRLGAVPGPTVAAHANRRRHRGRWRHMRPCVAGYSQPGRGGIKGAFAASALAALEEDTGLAADHFGLIAGTSSGGIIAIGLGLDMSAGEIRRFYAE
ncbi:MAG: patatin-like phospholipase family protein [Gammaproteobacteria bacterium]